MAKALLLKVLHDVLADYVVGLESDNLKLGVWSGKILFHNLQVNPTALNQLKLPVNIIHGIVNKLEVHIPWGHLSSKPVKVYIEGVSVLIGPLEKDSWGAEEVQARRLGIKRKWLENTEEEASKKDKKEEGDSKDKNFVEKLVQRIVDNIEISVSDIHFRYEDATLVEGQTMSAGLTLKSFVVTTTDEAFKPQYVDRTKEKRRHVKVHKLASVVGFSVYWHVDDKERFGVLPSNRIASALRAFVGTQSIAPHDENGGGLARGDLIRPSNAVLKFIHNDDPKDVKGPMFEASLEMDDVHLDVRAEQYEQVLILKDSISALVNWQAFYPYRPKVGPMENPKGWWRYAYICVRGMPTGWKKTEKVLASRKEYVALFERVAATTPPESKKRPPQSFKDLGLLKKLDKGEQKRFDALEEELPLETLLMFRTMVRKKLIRLREEAKRELEHDDGEKEKNWWEKLWHRDDDKRGQEKEEGDIALHDLGSGIDPDDKSSRPPDFLQIRVRVHPRMALRLYGRRNLPLLEARMYTSALLEVRQDGSLYVDFALTRSDVLDLFSPKPVFTHIVRVWTREEEPTTGGASAVSASPPDAKLDVANPLLRATVSLSKTALSVDVRAVPTDIVYHREVVDAVLSVFQTRPTESEAYVYGASKSLEKAQETAQELVKLAITVSLDVAAPTIIVPFATSSDEGFLLLDTGHVVLKGGTLEDGRSMEYDLEVKDITVRLPSSKAMLQSGTGDNLIQPFKIKVDVKLDETGPNPDVGLNVEVLPGVNGELSPHRIRNLFRVVDYITKADLHQQGVGAPPLGLNAPTTAAGSGVQIMGGEVLPVGRSAGDGISLEPAKDEGKEEDAERTVMMELKLRISTVSLLLVESEEAIAADTVDKDSGLLMQLQGMALEVRTSAVDLTVKSYLEALTLEDRARPDDSPYRFMISTTPDERSHGSLIYVTYWMSTDGGARVPPHEIAETDKAFNIVLDARFSTLQLALDRDCIVTSTPFFRAITRQDGDAADQSGALQRSATITSSRLPPPSSKVDDARSEFSVHQVVGAAKAVAGTGDGAPSILIKSSLTSVSLELVRSNPWERTIRAEVAGLDVGFSLDGEANGDMEAKVTLVAVALTDVRPEAKDYAYRGILAPILPSSQEALIGARLDEHGEADKEEKDDKEDTVAPIMSVTASKKGSEVTADVALASFAFNLMVEPIKETLDVVMGIQEALTKMLEQPDQASAEPINREASFILGLETLEEGDGDDMKGDGNAAEGALAVARKPEATTRLGASGQSEQKSPDGGLSLSISARMMLDDWRINLVEIPSSASSPVMISRSSLVATFKRTVTAGEGGDSTEDTIKVSIVKMETLVDQPPIGETPAAALGESALENSRRISQVLEPFSADLEVVLISVKGDIISASVQLIAKAMDCRVSYQDIMLVQRVVEQATAFAPPPAKVEDAGEGTDRAPCATPTASPEALKDSMAVAAASAGDGAQSHSRGQPKPMMMVTIFATCSMGRVVLVNDYEKQDVPVLSISTRKATLHGKWSQELLDARSKFPLKADGSGFMQDLRVEVSGQFQASSYNVGVVCWEPLVEPWSPTLTASLRQAPNGTISVRVDIECDQLMIVDLTAAFLESFLSTFWMLFSEGAKGDPMQSILSKSDESECDTMDAGDEDLDDDESTELQSNLSGRVSLDSGDPLRPALAWSGEEAKLLDSVEEGSVFVNNRSGLRLVVSTSDQAEKYIDVAGMDTVPLKFKPQRQYDPRVGESDLRGKEVLVKWAHGDGLEGARDELPPLEMDTIGTYVYPLHPADHVPSGCVVSAPIVVEAFQDQRLQLTRWKTPYMPGDGPEFWTKTRIQSNLQIKASPVKMKATTKSWASGASSGILQCPLESVPLPKNGKWEWRDEWHVDFSREVGVEIDASGWEYAVNFEGFTGGKARTHRDLDQARRRKWIRTRVPKPRGYEDPFRPLYVVWEVTATPQGRLEATIRSTVQIANKTDVSLDVRALSSAWDVDSGEAESSGPGGLGARSLGTFEPGAKLDIPVKMVYASSFQLRPSAATSPAYVGGSEVGEAGTMGTFEWSDPLPLLVNHADKVWDHWISCQSTAGGARYGGEEDVVRLVVHGEMDENGCLSVSVLPSVALVNCLPCPLRFRATHDGDGTPGLGSRLLESGDVPTAETVLLRKLQIGDGAGVAIKIRHHGWSNAVCPLPSGPPELRKGVWSKRNMNFKLPIGAGEGRYLDIRCQLEPLVGPKCPAVRLNVYCSHWLIDRTGLRLGFGVSENRRLAVPRANPSDVTTELPDASVRGSATAVHLCPVSELFCTTRRGATVVAATAGSLIYRDREYTLKADSLPNKLRGATMIRTSCSDKNEDKMPFIRFRVGETCTVHVLYDRRCTSPPDWLKKFHSSSRRAHVTHKTKRGKMAHCPFVVWSKNFPAGARVSLGGNKAKNADTMYLVIVTEQDVLQSITQTTERQIVSREDLEDSWALGSEGMRICNARNDKIWVAVPEGARYGAGRAIRKSDSGRLEGYVRDGWSDDLEVDPGANGVFQVRGARGESYELCLRAELCPGVFKRTTQVTVVPRYCFVNLLEGENIWVKQADAPDSSAVSIAPGGRLPWHWMMGNSGRRKSGLQVRTEKTAWSYGNVIVDRVGTTALQIPFIDEARDLSDLMSEDPSNLMKLEDEQVVVHVDVKLAETVYDEFAVLVAFWKASKRFAPIYIVRNTSPVAVTLHQDADNMEDYKNLKAKTAWMIKGGQEQQIGWVDPSAAHTLVIQAVDGPRAAALKADTIGNYVQLKTANASGTGEGPRCVWATVVVEGGTKVIRISTREPRRGRGRRRTSDAERPTSQSNLDTESSSSLKEESEAAQFEVAMNLRGFGLSLVAPTCGRRQEIIYAQVSDIGARLSHGRMTSIAASIGSMQVDNHFPDALYPVLVSGAEADTDDKGDGNNGDLTPFLQLSVIQEVNETTNTDHYDYVAFRILEVDVTADCTSVLRLLAQVRPVEGYLQRWMQQLNSRAWIAKRTAEIVERGASDVPGGYVDIDEVQRTARIQRKYFKTMTFHPIILRITYAASTPPEDVLKAADFAIIDKIPSLMNSRVELASYIVVDAFGSIKDISNNVVSHYTVAASMQALNLLGSIRALGSPADLISNVGGGFVTLVYAPAEGLVQGPAEFFEGIGRGTQSFVKGTVHGVTNAVAGVGGAVTDTLSILTFDEEYRQKREREKNKNMVNQRGVGKSLVQGGKNIVGGVTSGVTGIFSAPVSGAKTGGAGGFIKGLGKGLVGAVVKPVVGVTDAAVTVVQGVSNQTGGNKQRQKRVRPRRALVRDPETDHLVLQNFSLEAAMAQLLVETAKDGSGEPTGDKYESHKVVADSTFIFTNKRVVAFKTTEIKLMEKEMCLKRENQKEMGSIPWSEVLRVDVVDTGISIRRYGDDHISLAVTSPSDRLEVYRQFYAHRTRMGDPTPMKSPNELSGESKAERASMLTMRAHSNAVQQSLDDYTFGSVHKLMRVQPARLRDTRIVDIAEEKLESVGVGNWERLDAIAFELVQNWKNNNSGLASTRSLCVVMINASSSNVQVISLRKEDGMGYRLLLGPQCDRNSRQIMPGGVAILFGWAYQQTNILKNSYVVLDMETTAFSATFALQKEKLCLTSKGGFQVGFLEKTIHQWWSKQVVVIK